MRDVNREGGSERIEIWFKGSSEKWRLCRLAEYSFDRNLKEGGLEGNRFAGG